MGAPKDPKLKAVWIKRISDGKKGKRCSVGTEFKKGLIPWNKGKLFTQITGEKHPMYGKHQAQCTKDKISKTLQGNVPWNAGTKGTGIMKGNKASFKKGDVSYWKGKHLSKEHVRKILTRRTPSSLEKKFQGIIKKHNLPYKFVGDGSFFIEQFNPDFINTNSEKIAVEVYASFHKKRLFGNIEKWKEERQAIFKKYGWTIIYFDETQVNEKCVLSKLVRC